MIIAQIISAMFIALAATISLATAGVIGFFGALLVYSFVGSSVLLLSAHASAYFRTNDL